nr:hypothetical protein [Oculatella sp. LEGE 06141]
MERIESLKAGLIGAIATALVYTSCLVGHSLLPQLNSALLSVPARLMSWTGILSFANAVFAGFLFGVTYRYVIRADQNSHLKSGAVLAFGLVRGLAQVDMGVAVQDSPLTLIVLAAESVVLFAIARLVLDWALQQGWVKPFHSS